MSLVTLLALARPAAAADTSTTFVPWSGAGVTATTGDTSITAALASPAGDGASVAANVSIPAGVASGSPAGSWEAGASWMLSNGGDLDAEALATAIPKKDIDLARTEIQMAWCHVLHTVDKKAPAIISAEDVADALADTDGDVADMLAAVKAAKGDKYVPVSECPAFSTPGDDETRAKAFEEIGTFIARVGDILAQESIVASDANATPFDELARRRLKTTTWKLGVAAAYTGTVTTVGKQELAFLEESAIEVGITGQLYERPGLAQALSFGWEPTITKAKRTADPAFEPLQFYVQGGLGWASPELFKVATSETSAKGATTPGSLSYYVALQTVGRVGFGTETSVEATATVALRPTKPGIGLAAGPEISWSKAGGFSIGPLISISGELPNLSG